MVFILVKSNSKLDCDVDGRAFLFDLCDSLHMHRSYQGNLVAYHARQAARAAHDLEVLRKLDRSRHSFFGAELAFRGKPSSSRGAPVGVENTFADIMSQTKRQRRNRCPAYLKTLHEEIGHDLVAITAVSIPVFDDQGRLLIGKEAETEFWTLYRRRDRSE